MAENNNTRQRIFGALLANSIIRWESLVTIVVTVLLFLFGPKINLPIIEWQQWFWLVLGAIAETALVVSTMTDPATMARIEDDTYEKQYELGKIQNQVSRDRLNDAFEYRRNMLRLVNRSRGAMQTHLRGLVKDIEQWIAHMYNLAQHIDLFEDNELVARDRQQVPQQIEKVKIRIQHETDANVVKELENQLDRLQQQQMNLEATVSNIKRAEIQLESTLASLGTIYAQMSLLGTKDTDSMKHSRLSDEVKGEIDKLQDTIDAMEEVQKYSLTY